MTTPRARGNSLDLMGWVDFTGCLVARPLALSTPYRQVPLRLRHKLQLGSMAPGLEEVSSSNVLLTILPDSTACAGT